MTLPGDEYGLDLPTCATNNSKLFTNRRSLVKHCHEVIGKKNTTIAEVGVFQGYFSQMLLDTFQPQKLNLIDSFNTTDFITKEFTAETHFEYIKNKYVNNKNVTALQGLSWDTLATLPDLSCDFIYIDADHTYESVTKDIQAALPKLKHNGIIQFNDYCNFSQVERRDYGVFDAVNTFMKNNADNISIVGLSIDKGGYHDIAVRVAKKVNLTIVTPCSRPYNLLELKNSIDFTKIDKWYIVHDVRNMPFKKQFNDAQIVELVCTDNGSVGHQIRNMMLKQIPSGLVYFLDDDTIIHPNFWNIDFAPNKIYTFDTIYNKAIPILKGDTCKICHVDMCQIVFDMKLVGDITFQQNVYEADGIFIEAMVKKNKENWVYIPETCAYYNKLNQLM
jgi:predicted O-methyltransferase YrrM